MHTCRKHLLSLGFKTLKQRLPPQWNKSLFAWAQGKNGFVWSRRIYLASASNLNSPMTQAISEFGN